MDAHTHGPLAMYGKSERHAIHRLLSDNILPMLSAIALTLLSKWPK
jgi:hypothetical protein